MGFGPATRPTLKKALCHTSPVVGRKTNTWVLPSLTLGQSDLLSMFHINPSLCLFSGPFTGSQQKQFTVNLNDITIKIVYLLILLNVTYMGKKIRPRYGCVKYMEVHKHRGIRKHSKLVQVRNFLLPF